MKISVQEEGKEKQIFFSFQDASQARGIQSSTLMKFIKNKNKQHDRFTRRFDRKVLTIKEETDEPFIRIEGEDFFTMWKVTEKFGISRTVLISQLLKKKKSFS